MIVPCHGHLGIHRGQLPHLLGQLGSLELRQVQQNAFDAFVDLEDTKSAIAAATHRHRFQSFSSGTADMAARALDLVLPDSMEAGYVLETLGAVFADHGSQGEG